MYNTAMFYFEKKSLLRKFLPVLAVCVVSLCGCTSPTTGRVRDTNLLYNRGRNPEIVGAEKFGPFYDSAYTSGFNERISLRPFIYTYIKSPKENAELREIAWPLYSSHSRNDSLSWRFLTCYGTDFDVNDPESRYRLWCFPFWFQGKTKHDENYAALFPIYGTIREMYFDKISFALFPLWLNYEQGDIKNWSVLWPIVSHSKGNDVFAFRVWPLYGYSERGIYGSTRFVLWPFWTSGTYSDVNAGSSWMLWPVMGHVDRENEDAWLVLPPFFTYAQGRGKTPYFRKINCPWPFVRILDEKEYHKRYFLPFWGRHYNNDYTYDAYWVMWPFYRSRDIVRHHGALYTKERSLFPIFHSTSSLRDTDNDGKYDLVLEDYMRVWPLYSRRSDEQNLYTKIPDLSFSKSVGTLDRNFLNMFTLYTFGKTRDPYRVDHEALWGLFRRGYGDGGYSAFRLWPLYNSKSEKDTWKWSLLCGLIGREGDEESTAWRYFWFFGGKKDNKESSLPKENVK